jgi:Arc/MetJ family transcription regulator
MPCVSLGLSIHIGGLPVRTNIVIDDKLMEDALRATGLKTKREAVELGLRTLIRLRQQETIRSFRGKLRWEGDLEEMRTDS